MLQASAALPELIRPVEPTPRQSGRDPQALHGRSWIRDRSGKRTQRGLGHNRRLPHLPRDPDVLPDARRARPRIQADLEHRLPTPLPLRLRPLGAATWQAQWKLGKDAPYGTRTVGEYVQRPKFELYDIENDPDEAHNLASETSYAETLQLYKTKLKEFQKSTGDRWILKWEYE